MHSLHQKPQFFTCSKIINSPEIFFPNGKGQVSGSLLEVALALTLIIAARNQETLSFSRSSFLMGVGNGLSGRGDKTQPPL
jgi:hypothetical protein